MAINLIEVTDSVSDSKVTINLDQVEEIVDLGEKTLFVFFSSSRTAKENYQEIKSRLEQVSMKK